MSDVVLSASQQAALGELISAERQKTLAQLAALGRDFDAIVEWSASAPPDDEHDPEGQTLAFERAQITTLLAQARSHLADLDWALERLAAGTYGTCERCGEAIVFERLEARPTAHTCVRCAAVAEKMARRGL